MQRIKIMILLSTLMIAGMTTANAAAPTSGEWVGKFWDDTKKGYATWNICIQSNNDWYISTVYNDGWKGKWFNKGNDTHLQAIHSSGALANSFDVSRISDNLLAGYYKLIDNAGNTNYATITLSYKGATCPAYIP